MFRLFVGWMDFCPRFLGKLFQSKWSNWFLLALTVIHCKMSVIINSRFLRLFIMLHVHFQITPLGAYDEKPIWNTMGCVYDNRHLSDHYVCANKIAYKTSLMHNSNNIFFSIEKNTDEKSTKKGRKKDEKEIKSVSLEVKIHFSGMITF